MKRNELVEWFNEAVEIIYPPLDAPVAVSPLAKPYCEVCGNAFLGELGEPFCCSNCAGRQWSMDRGRAAYLATDDVRELIVDFKYNRRFHRLPRLSQWLIDGYERFYAEELWTALVPVPLHSQRRRWRGFNQAWELSRRLSRHSKVPVWNLIKRIRNTPTQTFLRRSERLKSQKGAYRLRREVDLAGARLLLIDDVLTTGATVDACAQVLKKAGAAHVSALTIARG